MKPTRKDYIIKMKPKFTGKLAEAFVLSELTGGNKKRSFQVEDFCFNNGLRLPRMTQKAIVAWFRAAADAVEKAELE